jgi:predicted enzyme related to lactoylglutathione lyase
MRKYLIMLLPLFVFTGCIKTPAPTGKLNDTAKAAVSEVETKDTTPRVTGIGGIFFSSDNPQETRAWYGKNLGLSISDYGSTFEFRNVNRPEEINYLQWSPFKKGNAYFAPSKKEFMINYRVQNIEGLVRQFKANGVTVLDNIETYDYGKFVHIMDPEGNKLELWEPVDSVLTKIGEPTTR